MIKLAIGVVIGIVLMTTFPEQTAQLSNLSKTQVNQAAKYIAEQTR